MRAVVCGSVCMCGGSHKHSSVYSLHFFHEGALLSGRFGTQVETVAIAGSCFCARFEHAVKA